jgi:hypothetical protein
VLSKEAKGIKRGELVDALVHPKSPSRNTLNATSLDVEAFQSLVGTGWSPAPWTRSCEGDLENLNCGVDVLCLRAVEPPFEVYTSDACIAALNRFMAKARHDGTHQLDLRCVPADSALPYDPRRSDR